MNVRCHRPLLSLVCLLALSASCFAEVRIKDITSIEGVASNYLFGTGLVVGLRGTGGRSLSTQQLAIEMLKRMEQTTKLNRQTLLDNVFKSTNISEVTVTAELPPFARKGSKIDVMVETLDDATSLEGGVLIMTPLRGFDNEFYVTAQGPLTIGGFNVRQNVPGGQSNHPTVARAINGGTVEREALSQIDRNGIVNLVLRDADPMTAKLIMLAINRTCPAVARTIDPGMVQIRVPLQRRMDIPDFVGEIGQLCVVPDTRAKVVINERTGTVIVGNNVRISALLIAHGNLSIKPNVTLVPTQNPAPPPEEQPGPPPSENGDPVDEILKKLQQPRTLPGGDAPLALHDVEQTFTVADLARVLNALGVSPRDLIAIFQAIKESGYLHADLVFN